MVPRAAAPRMSSAPFDEKGLGAIVNSSRAVLTAWQKQNRPGSEYAAAARDEAIRMRDDITQYLPEIRL